MEGKGKKERRAEGKRDRKRRRGEKGWKGKEIKGEWQMEGRGNGKKER
jgi:hypothetical protein